MQSCNTRIPTAVHFSYKNSPYKAFLAIQMSFDIFLALKKYISFFLIVFEFSCYSRTASFRRIFLLIVNFIAKLCILLARRQRETGSLVLRHSVPLKILPFSTFYRIL